MSMYKISELYKKYETQSQHLDINGFYFHKTKDSRFYLNIGLLGSYAFQPLDTKMFDTDESVLYQGNAYNYDDLGGHSNALAEYNHINLPLSIEDYIESIPNSKYRWELRRVLKEVDNMYYIADGCAVPQNLIDHYSSDVSNTQPLIYSLMPYIPGSNLLIMYDKGTYAPVAYIMVRYEEGVLFYLGSFIDFKFNSIPYGNQITMRLIIHAIQMGCTNFDFCNLIENSRTEYKKKFFNHKGYVPVVAHNIDVPWLNTNPRDIESFFCS